MLRDHSFRKANISIAIAVTAMAIAVLIFGRDASDTEVQLVTGVGFAVMIVSLLAQYELEYRRDQRSSTRTSDPASPQRPAPRPAAPPAPRRRGP